MDAICVEMRTCLAALIVHISTPIWGPESQEQKYNLFVDLA